MNKLPIVVIGGGGHASVLVDILKSQQREIKAIISPDCIASRKVFDGIIHLSSDDDILSFSSEEIELVNAIGASPRSSLRRQINEKYLALGFRFATIIAPHAYVSEHARIGDGVQIFNHAVINPGAIISQHSVINTGAIIEHDCSIGEYNFIAPGAVLCGQVKTKANVFVGAGATIIQNQEIHENAIVAAGAIVVASLAAGQVCYPSKMFIK